MGAPSYSKKEVLKQTKDGNRPGTETKKGTTAAKAFHASDYLVGHAESLSSDVPNNCYLHTNSDLYVTVKNYSKPCKGMYESLWLRQLVKPPKVMAWTKAELKS